MATQWKDLWTKQSLCAHQLRAHTNHTINLNPKASPQVSHQKGCTLVILDVEEVYVLDSLIQLAVDSEAFDLGQV